MILCLSGFLTVSSFPFLFLLDTRNRWYLSSPPSIVHTFANSSLNCFFDISYFTIAVNNFTDAPKSSSKSNIICPSQWLTILWQNVFKDLHVDIRLSMLLVSPFRDTEIM